mgnify:CR=1 FL=1|jgi:hypothetical protein
MTTTEIIKAILAALTSGVEAQLTFDGINLDGIGEIKALTVTVRAGKTQEGDGLKR